MGSRVSVMASRRPSRARPAREHGRVGPRDELRDPLGPQLRRVDPRLVHGNPRRYGAGGANTSSVDLPVVGLRLRSGVLLPLAIRDAFDQIALATERLTAVGGSTTLTVSVLPSFATKWLVPRLGRVRAGDVDEVDQHPAAFDVA